MFQKKLQVFENDDFSRKWKTFPFPCLALTKRNPLQIRLPVSSLWENWLEREKRTRARNQKVALSRYRFQGGTVPTYPQSEM